MKADASIDRLPPQSLEAEQSVLGAVLIDPDSLLKCLDLVKEGDFYRDSHRKIYTVMLDLFERNEAIDLITVSEALGKKNELEAVGGSAYIATLASQVPTAANIKYHSRIIRERALLRELLRTSTDIASRVYEDTEEAEVLLDFAEKSIFDISEKRMNQAFTPMKDVVKGSFKAIEELYERKDSITGVATGFRDLDEITTGLQKADLIVVGGRPSMGKTAMSLNIAQHVGVENKGTVAIFSLEMSTKQLVMRILCAEARVDSNNVRKGRIEKSDWPKLTGAAGRLMESPVFIDDSSTINVLEMRAKARRLKMEHGLSLVIVDYIQLMHGRSGFERRDQEISDITRSLKGLAKELEVPVIALSQLNRGVELRTDKRPTLADLRESGAIEQDADVIIFLYRDEVYNKDNPDARGKAEFIVAKQRNGPVGTIKVSFIGNQTRFADLADDRYYGSEPDIDDDVF
ncbi:replicative DNA helicase [Nitrospirota bacterium]